MTTESDRELLELAAKAAGMDGAKYQEPEGWFEVRYGMTQAMYHESTGYWNPLEDDGDALRLAAKLYLWEAIRLAHREVSADVDIYATTRRAIVRAAAEIARATHKEQT